MRHLRVIRSSALPPAQALDSFWEPMSLRAFWPNIVECRAGFDDGLHQEVNMTVERDGQLEHIRVLRLRQGRRIWFVNPTPPPAMEIHVGVWSFQETERGGSDVAAERWYRLRRSPDESEEVFARRDRSFYQRFAARLDALLQNFVKWSAHFPPPIIGYYHD